jgi:hypothetical protein
MTDEKPLSDEYVKIRDKVEATKVDEYIKERDERRAARPNPLRVPPTNPLRKEDKR